MTKAPTLIPVRYSDGEKRICLTNYADTVVYDTDGARKTLCAIRFGGYPEQVEAMANVIIGGGTIELTLGENTITVNTLTKQYRKKVSHDGVYAEAALFASDDKRTADDKETQQSESSGDAEQTELRDLPPRVCYIYVAAGDRAALYDAIDARTAVPLIPEFADYLIDALEECGDLKPLTVRSASMNFEAWTLKCDSGDENIIEVVKCGLCAGKIHIPGASEGTPMVALNGVTDYLTRFGSNIAERIKKSFTPLFDPERDALSPEVLAVNATIEQKAGYSLYDAQLAVAEAIKRQLARRKVGLIIAECGAGKTKIGLAAIAAATAGLRADQTRRGKHRTFNIVLCPAHVAEKWCREIAESLPDTKAAIVSNITQLDRLYTAYAKGDTSCYAVISKENARDGYMRAPSVRWSKLEDAFVCPDCGKIIEMDVFNGGVKYRVDADQFFFRKENRANHKCEHCDSPLWTALNPSVPERDWVKIGGYGFVFRPRARAHLSRVKNAAFAEKVYKIAEGNYRTVGAHRKYPLSAYLKKRYSGRVDGVIVDELHQYSNDSGQGDAMAEIFGIAKKVVGMTATLINGYASGVFYLLYRLVPDLMRKDGKSHSGLSEFISEYGVVENTYETVEADYNANRRTVKQKTHSRPLPGVSPLVYSRFLLECAAFLSLTDMGKDLPEYEEIPVALELPKEIQNVCGQMQHELRKVLRTDRKAGQKILSAYLNLLTAYPDQPYGQSPVLHPFTGEPIVTPPDMGSIDDVMPKDNAVLEIARRKIAAGENVLIYTNWTRLDSQRKLLKLLTKAGYSTEILPAAVPPVKREAWVAERLEKGLQILITNPNLVETGLDLNAFTTLIFYDTGFKLFTLRQSSRRSWRINQIAPRVEVYLLYYVDTMQHKAIKLMASKLAVAAIIEGGFSEEGLAAMSQCEDMTSLMAKELMLGIRDSVEDVSSAFRRMAFTKQTPRAAQYTVSFSDTPVEIVTALNAPPLVEFTFAPETAARTAGITVFPPAKPNRRAAALENQLTLFELTA
jgi:superfamily II DNA or RNA helicase/rubredoxin